MKIALALVLCALGAAGLASAAPEFNGTVTGSIDGHALDVRVVCERESTPGGGWLQAKSDPSMHGGNQDRNGDGIAVTINASRAQGQGVFEILVAGQSHRFTAAKDLQFTDAGLALRSTLDRYDGKGKSRKVVGSFEVDLTVTCPGG